MSEHAVIVTSADELERIVARAVAREVSAALAPRQEWATIPDAAQHFGKSKDTVRRWVREGTLESRTVGGQKEVRIG